MGRSANNIVSVMPAGCGVGILASQCKKAFSPLDLPGCILWLDATDRNTTFADVGGTVPASVGGDVYRWKDKSPEGNHVDLSPKGLTWTSPAKLDLTTYGQNGQPMVSFTKNTVGRFANNRPFLGLSGGATRVAVFRVWNTTTAGGHWLYSAGAAQAYSDNYYTRPAVVETFGVRGQCALGISLPAHLTVCTEMATGDGTNASFFLNDHATPRTTATFGSGTGAWDWRDLSYQMNGDTINGGGSAGPLIVASVLVYNRPLGTSERRALNQYLNWTWGLGNA